MADDENSVDFNQVDINKEMKDAYLQYSMSVIVGRALPDIRDGLKPVHRRVLYAMYQLNNTHDKPYKKSARVVGDVIGKYHPHGDMAVYDAVVRMAQDFSLRYPLVDGQGNFGSVDGDAPAAPRYTEARMNRLAEELLTDIDKETVLFDWNYDDTLLIPRVLPAKFPNLLVNGSAGIAVGMATNVPPHNLTEVIEGCIALIRNPDITIDELIEYIPGPDFPTAGTIAGSHGIIAAYKKGRGVISIRASADIETKKDKDEIVITEIPYQVNKAKLIESIANLVRDKKLEGIADIRDESSREGMRVVVSLKKGENGQVILNRLYKYTQMQVSYGIIMLGLDGRMQPRTFNLKDVLEAFVEHRKDVVTKRCIYDLKKAEARAHILEGLTKALDNIDAVVNLIRQSKETAAAKEQLKQNFDFSDKQAQAILEMRLQRLTGLERQKILDELEQINKRIEWLKTVLADVNEIYNIIVEELEDIKKTYGDKRRTKIEQSSEDLEDEDLIAREEMVVVMTYAGYIKRIPLDQYRLQKRGGKGLKGTETKEEDFVWRVFTADTLTTLLAFSDRGKVYWIKVHKLPQGSRVSKGRAINNVLSLSSGEKIRGLLPVKDFSENRFVVMLTEKGVIKKTSLDAFSRPRPSGLIALTTDLDDYMTDAMVSTGHSDILLFTREGMSIRFDEGEVRAMGRTARGVKGVTLGANDKVISMEIVEKDAADTIFIVTENGYGKRTPLEEYRTQTRSGVGVITQKITKKVGEVVGARYVNKNTHVLVTTNKGQAIRMSCSDISIMGRNTQGVKVMELKEGEFVTGLARIDADSGENEN